MPGRLKPPFGTRLTRSAARVRPARFVPFNEGTGVPYDPVRLLACSVSASRPTWVSSPYGPARRTVAASSQSDGFGVMPETSGAAKFTMILLARRVTAGAHISWGRFLDGTHNVFFGPHDTSNAIIFQVSNGGAAFGTFANTDLNWHHIALVYDGTQTGNAARLKGYVDGIARTLTFTGTVPATAFTDSVTGSGLGAVTGTGEHAGYWFYRDPLGADQIATHYRDPWGLFESWPEDVSIYAPVTPIVVVWSNAQPDDDPAERDDVVSIDAYPTNVLDPILSMDLSVDGVDVAPTVTALSGGGQHGSYAFRFRYGHTYSLVWSATAQSGVTNTHEETFTVREDDYLELGERVALINPARAHRIERVTISAPGRVLRRSEKTQIVVAAGKMHRIEGTSIIVVEGLPPGYYRLEKTQIIVGRTISIPDLIRLAMQVGDPYFSGLRLAEDVDGLDPTAFRLAEEVISSEFDTALALAEEIASPEDTALVLAEDVGPAEQTTLRLAVETDGSAFDPASGFGEIVSRSEIYEEEES